MFESANDGGTSIQLYELWRDQGTQGSSFAQVTTYTDNSLTHTLTTTNDGIVSGVTYTFKTRSKNVLGYSDYSREVRIAVASPPNKPAAPIKVYAESGKTFITVDWQTSSGTEIPVLGYELQISADTNEFKTIYYANDNSLTTKWTASDLITAQLYQFRVAAVNFNGLSAFSDSL